MNTNTAAAAKFTTIASAQVPYPAGNTDPYLPAMWIYVTRDNRTQTFTVSRGNRTGAFPLHRGITAEAKAREIANRVWLADANACANA